MHVIEHEKQRLFWRGDFVQIRIARLQPCFHLVALFNAPTTLVNVPAHLFHGGLFNDAPFLVQGTGPARLLERYIAKLGMWRRDDVAAALQHVLLGHGHSRFGAHHNVI